MKNDIVNVVADPEVTIGTLTANANIGETVLNVSSTVTDNAIKGMDVQLTDGVNTEELGRIITAYFLFFGHK